MRDYMKDSYVKSFTAKIMNQKTLEDGRQSVILDRSYFYPTSGGQPTDLGLIEGVKVVDVIEDGDKILHIVEKPIQETEVSCEIDWKRRFDHMQQHSGQHLLSACFDRLYDAETVGFHLGEEYVTIDVTLTEFTRDMADQVEILANEVIYHNLPIKAYFIEPEKVKELPLRKSPVKDSHIRIVEIEGFDYSPCGGTHLKATGEIGLIKIRKWEKKRNNIRVEFVCGFRALRDYQWKNAQINAISNELTCKDQEVLDGFHKLSTEVKSLRQELNSARDLLNYYEAEKFYQTARQFNGVHIVKEIFDNKGLDELKRLAGKIADKEKVIVLFAAKGEKAQVFFRRSEDLDVNMNELLKRVIGLIDGRGGGNALFAQGGGTYLNNLEGLLEGAEMILTNEILN